MDSGRSIPGAPAVLRGTGRAGKSRAARGAVPHCASAEAPRLGVQGAISSSGGALILSPPGAFSLGPLQRRRLGRRSRHGPSGPRRKCGVRRREPVCRATGVYSIKRGPAALCAVGNKREWGAVKHPSWRGLRLRPPGAQKSLGRALRGTARPRRAPPSCGETFPGSKKKKAAAGPLFLDLSAYFMKRMAVLAIMSFSPASSNWMRRSISPPMGVTSTIFPGPKALCRMCIPGRKSGNGALWGA